jgi:hypothetical protein
MPTSGEQDEWKVIDTFCAREMDDDSPCPWMGRADVCITSDDWAHFHCGNGHRNDFKWEDDSC